LLVPVKLNLRKDAVLPGNPRILKKRLALLGERRTKDLDNDSNPGFFGLLFKVGFER
jgi:hypothetical protein